MPQGPRTERVGEGFREILAEAIQKLKDPRIGFVTVTGVRVSHDLQVAWVYFTALGDASAKAGSRAALRSAAPAESAALRLGCDPGHARRLLAVVRAEGDGNGRRPRRGPPGAARRPR